MILTADWHLGDKDSEEYRWSVFDMLKQHALRGERIYILGDLCDRKDRHSAKLVNRLCEAFEDLRRKTGSRITILKGNHDQPLAGDPFWKFLNWYEGIEFIFEPGEDEHGILLLPHSPNPIADWADIDLQEYQTIFMHQPVNGAYDGGFQMTKAPPLPDFKPTQRIYSGDIHAPQTVAGVEYVGAPHPVRFGDTHKCRLLRLHTSTRYFGTIKEAIDVRGMRKHTWRLGTLKELDASLSAHTQPGDQLKVVFTLPLARMDEWGTLEKQVATAAERADVSLVGLEAEVVMPSAAATTTAAPIGFATFEEALQAFVTAEGLDEATADVGAQFLKAAQDDGRSL